MKHEYLIDLLKNNKTVIIPNIGAISNSDSPTHQYIFNEYLKFDDGMIVKYISTKEGKSLDEAGDDLDKFTQGFSDLLNQGKEVVIPQIGILSKVDGKTVFHCDTNASGGTKISTSSIEDKKIEPEIEKKSEPIIETKPETKIEKQPEPVVEKKPEPVVETKPETPTLSRPKEVNPKPETKIEKKPEPVIEKKPDPVIETKPETKNEKLKTSPSKPKKKRKLVWIILIIVLLGGGGTAGFIFKDQLMEMIGMNETTASKNEEKAEVDTNDSKEEKVEEKINEEPVEEVIPEEETESNVASESMEETVEEPIVEEKVEEPVEEVKIPVQAATASPGNYYIIVGCYSNQGNADNMISKVSAAGLSPTNVGTFNSLIHVAAGSASDMQGALQQLNAVRGTFPSAWIMKH